MTGADSGCKDDRGSPLPIAPYGTELPLIRLAVFNR